MTTTLILAGEAIVATADAVTVHEWGYETADGRYPFNAGVTATAEAELPDDFSTAKYAYRAGALVVRDDWVEPVPPPPPVVVSVLPVAFRRALRNTPAPAGPEVFALADSSEHALAYVIAALNQPGYEEPKDAFEYMVRAERQDLVALGGALGFTVEQIDGVLALAATYPGSDAVYGPAS